MTLFFVTDRADAHVARFDALFQSVTSDYQRVSVTYAEDGEPLATVTGVPCHSWDSIRASLSGEASVVISGPLDTVSTRLRNGEFRHIGISFATDVMVIAAKNVSELGRLKVLAPSLDSVVTDNYATENALISVGVPREKILRLPWGPDTSSSSSSMTRSDCGWPDNRPVVLYPRSLEPHYAPGVFVDALSKLVTKLPDVFAVFVESGSLVEEIKHEIATRGLGSNVHFEAPREPDVFRSMMRCADVVVVTPRTDGTSVTVMDAMAQGIPVVSSLTPGSAEWVIEGVTGWTFPVGDSDALANAMERALVIKAEDKDLIIDNARRLVGMKAGWAESSTLLTEVIHRLLVQH